MLSSSVKRQHKLLTLRRRESGAGIVFSPVCVCLCLCVCVSVSVCVYVCLEFWISLDTSMARFHSALMCIFSANYAYQHMLGVGIMVSSLCVYFQFPLCNCLVLLQVFAFYLCYLPCSCRSQGCICGQLGLPPVCELHGGQVVKKGERRGSASLLSALHLVTMEFIILN